MTKRKLKWLPRFRVKLVTQTHNARNFEHNEELIVAPCGIILARRTFYGPEGVGSVAVHVLVVNNA